MISLEAHPIGPGHGETVQLAPAPVRKLPNALHLKIVAINFLLTLTPLLFAFEIWQK